MKTLALILLVTFSVIATAQDTTAQSGRLWFRTSSIDCTPRFIFTDHDSVVVIAAGDTVRTRGNPYLIGFELFLLREWDAYKAECYADSALNYYKMSIPERMDSLRAHQRRGDYRWIYYPGVVWRHHEPTFPGFVEYIKRKVNP